MRPGGKCRAADKDTEESAETAAPADLPDDLSDEELWQAATGDVESLENAPARPRRRGEDSEAPKKGSVRAAAVKAKVAAGKRRMFISVLPGEQVEVAIAEEGRLQEYYLDMFHQRKLKGNIYKGVIHNIDTNLQAAFVSYGAGKNGFLQIDEIHPEYWLTHHEPSKGKKFPPIQKVLKPGQEVLVQVVKEPTGNKGAFLTTWLSLAGRFLVLTPGQEQIGVSRKVDSDEERTRLREMMNGIDPGPGPGRHRAHRERRLHQDHAQERPPVPQARLEGHPQEGHRSLGPGPHLSGAGPAPAGRARLPDRRCLRDLGGQRGSGRQHPRDRLPALPPQEGAGAPAYRRAHAPVGALQPAPPAGPDLFPRGHPAFGRPPGL